MLSIGLVGLPNAGKSSLFNLLTKRSVPAENFPFTTIEPNDGIVEVPDSRLHELALLAGTTTEISAMVEFRDIAGLIKNAHKGEGLGNQFLSHIREVDMILLVVRRYENENVVHVENRVSPLDDEEILIAELCMSDEKSLQSHILKATKELSKNPKNNIKIELGNKLLEQTSSLKPAIDIQTGTDDEEVIKWRKSLGLLTDKKILRLGNIMTDGKNVEYKCDFDIDILLENDVEGMSIEERVEFGAPEKSGLDRLIRQCYNTLGLETYFTAGVKEARAWTFNNGTKAPQCAAIIHSDFEKKFIKVEVVAYDDYIKYGSLKEASSAGKLRQEGKEYIMKDGDVVEFVINGQ
jgi:ribosome-binding ATPase